LATEGHKKIKIKIKIKKWKNEPELILPEFQEIKSFKVIWYPSKLSDIQFCFGDDLSEFNCCNDFVRREKGGCLCLGGSEGW